MAERSVVVRIRAEISDFRSQMKQAAQSAEEVGKSAEQSASRSSTATGRLIQDATKHSESWSKAGTALLGFGGVVVAGVGLAIAKYAEFDKAMSDVQSSTHETKGNMDLLREAAIQAGADTAFSAKDAAEGIDELAKAGVSTADVFNGGLNGALSLAAAGSLAVGDAAEIAATALTQFKLKGSDIPHVADLLAAGAGKAQGSVEDIGMALKQSGLVASQFGLSVDDTVGSLAAFASAGLVGSDAGTSLKTMLLKLASPSKEAAGMMSELGIAAYDAQGKFVGVTGLAQQLHDKLGNLTQAQRDSTLATIFGTDAIRGANVLYQQGADGIQGWIDKVNDAGYAAVTASIKQDNLAGDIEKVGGSLDSVFIKTGAGANDALRGLAQSANNLIDFVGKIPEPVLQTGLALAGAVGGGALLTGTLLKLIPSAIDTFKAFKNLGSEGSKLPGTLGKIGKAAGIAAAALAAMQIATNLGTEKHTKSAEDYGNAILKIGEAGEKASASNLDSVFQGYNKFFGMTTQDANSTKDAIDDVLHVNFTESMRESIGNALGMTTPLDQVKERFEGIGNSLSDMVKGGAAPAAAKTFNTLADAFKKSGGSAQDALDNMPAYKDALLASAKAAGVNVEGQDLLDLAAGKIPATMAAATTAQQINAQTAEVQAQVSAEVAKQLEDIGINASGAVTDLDKLVTAMQAAGLIQLSANDALRQYYASLDAVDESIKKNGTSLDIHTEKGRANQAALDDVAKSGLAVVQANAKNGASQEELSKNLHTTYDDLIANYGAFGITGDKADTMARQVLGIPKDVSIDTAIQNFADTMAKAAQVKTAVEQIPNKKTIFFQTDASGFYDPSAGSDGHGAGSGSISNGRPRGFATGGLIEFASGGHVGGFPSGGLLQGPGTGTSDSMIARVSNGEYIIPAQRVQQLGVGFFDGIRAGQYAPAKSMAGGYGANMSQSYGLASRSFTAATPAEVHNHYHIDAKPGLAYEYGLDIADQAVSRTRDLNAAYGVNRIS